MPSPVLRQHTHSVSHPQLISSMATTTVASDTTLPADAKDTISSLSWSPSASHLAASSWDGRVRIYDVLTDGSHAQRAAEFTVGQGAPLLSCDWVQVSRPLLLLNHKIKAMYAAGKQGKRWLTTQPLPAGRNGPSRRRRRQMPAPPACRDGPDHHPRWRHQHRHQHQHHPTHSPDPRRAPPRQQQQHQHQQP